MYDVCTSKKRICIKFIKLVQSYYNVVTFSDVLIQTLHVCWLVPRITLCEMTASTILGNSEVL